MAEHNYTVELDLSELKAMVAAIVPYIYGDELYGRLSINSARLTPGAMLLRLRRLDALRPQLSAKQREQFEALRQQHAALRNEWNVAYTRKMLREAESRLRDIHTYLRECKEDLKLCANAYLPEALRRTIIAELLAELNESDIAEANLKETLISADSGLRRFSEPVDFLWAPLLQAIYPQETHWWLYQRPPHPE